MVNSGPIPGANFTSDTKNYPWHQPPEFTDISDALDKIVEKITQDAPVHSILSLAELEFPLYRIASMVIMEGVSEGKWTVDMGLLLVGPTTKIIELICDNFGVTYKTGLEEKPIDEPTGYFYRANLERKLGKKNKVLSVIGTQVEEVKQEAEQQGAEPEQDLQEEGFATMKGAPKPEQEGAM